MAKYNPAFREVPVDPAIINNRISESSVFCHDPVEIDEEAVVRKKKLDFFINRFAWIWSAM
ncbi:MAG: hypothetical protein JXB88_24780 [Spirochaetales bacterium]|nr:hypothetical protein [Spirochaetales bacterium]